MRNLFGLTVIWEATDGFYAKDGGTDRRIEKAVYMALKRDLTPITGIPGAYMVWPAYKWN